MPRVFHKIIFLLIGVLDKETGKNRARNRKRERWSWRWTWLFLVGYQASLSPFTSASSLNLLQLLFWTDLPFKFCSFLHGSVFSFYVHETTFLNILLWLRTSSSSLEEKYIFLSLSPEGQTIYINHDRHSLLIVCLLLEQWKRKRREG